MGELSSENKKRMETRSSCNRTGIIDSPSRMRRWSWVCRKVGLIGTLRRTKWRNTQLANSGINNEPMSRLLLGPNSLVKKLTLVGRQVQCYHMTDFSFFCISLFELFSLYLDWGHAFHIWSALPRAQHTVFRNRHGERKLNSTHEKQRSIALVSDPVICLAGYLWSPLCGQDWTHWKWTSECGFGFDDIIRFSTQFPCHSRW